jgi:hypothetical protein
MMASDPSSELPQCCAGRMRRRVQSPGTHTPLSRWVARAKAAGGWFIPSMLLALVPKCPLCLAVYLSVTTGIGVSMTTARYLRWSWLGLCLVSLFYLVAQYSRDWSGKRRLSISGPSHETRAAGL